MLIFCFSCWHVYGNSRTIKYYLWCRNLYRASSLLLPSSCISGESTPCQPHPKQHARLLLLQAGGAGGAHVHVLHARGAAVVAIEEEIS